VLSLGLLFTIGLRPCFGVLPFSKKEDSNMLKHAKIIIQELIHIAEMAIIQSNFVSKFMTVTKEKNGKGKHYLHGEIKLCGCQSARPNSGGASGVNMLNLPSTGTIWAKPIKKCFTSSGEGRLMCGADFTGES
jgi:hypothetical protein